MFQDRAAEYRAWAAQCRAMVARAKSEKDKGPWLELADKWQRLADRVSPDGPAQQAQQPSREKFQAETLPTMNSRSGSALVTSGRTRAWLKTKNPEFERT